MVDRDMVCSALRNAAVYACNIPGGNLRIPSNTKFKYGKKIHDMIASKAKPEFDTDEPIYVWDLEEGCNFKLRIKVASGYPNYDSSEWDHQSAISDDDDVLQGIIDKCHRLGEFTEPGRFKSYDVLKGEFDRVMNGVPTTGGASAKAKNELDDDPPFDLDKEVAKAAQPARKVEKPVEQKSSIDDDDDDLDSFRKLLENM